MIVVDTNVIAYLLLPGDHSGGATQAFQKDAEWCAPFLWRSAFRSILATYIQSKRLAIADAFEVMDAAEDLMTGGEYDVRSTDVLRLAAESRCSAYDCEYVALAMDLRVPLLTTDKQLLKTFPDVARSIAALSE